MKMNRRLSKKNSTSIIALDADGVLLDYNAAYRLAWYRAFGELPELIDPNAYWAIDRWNVRRIDGDELAHFRTFFDENYWRTIPALPNAVKACKVLHDAGFDLVCVSAVESQFERARFQNLLDCGFPISKVIATSGMGNAISPKAAALRELDPIAFADDFLPYLRGIPSEIHKALIMREPNGTPNTGDELKIAHSVHSDLNDFATWWLSSI